MLFRLSQAGWNLFEDKSTRNEIELKGMGGPPEIFICRNRRK